MNPQVTFYTRAGCHLCEVALAVIERVGNELDFSLDVVDIAGDQALIALYGEKIPVILVDSRLHAKYRVAEQAFRRRLAAGTHAAQEPA